jgi:hypothetical protein
MRSFALTLAVLLLSAGPAAAGKNSVKTDFNPSAEFERYKTWAWSPDVDQPQYGVLHDARMRERVQAALAKRLRNAGLREATGDEKPDVLVSYKGDVGEGKTVTTSNGAVSHGVSPEYATLEFTEQIATLVVDLVDAGTSTLAWRLYVDQAFGGPADSPDKLAKALDKGFAKYPPSPSERKRKARELEK